MNNKEKFEDIYFKLYDTLTESDANRIRFTVPLNRPMWTSFTAVKGCKFDEQTKYRFMLVGRAINGWDEARFYDEGLSKEEFVSSSLKNLFNDVSTHLPEREDRFDWISEISEEGIAPTNQYRKGIDFSEELILAEPYYLSMPLWNYTMEVWCRLTGNAEKTAWTQKWYEKIVWSNLYKVAPTMGGNPDEKLKALQLGVCKELLKTEIEEFKPTHILFVTGYSGWFENFNNLMGEEILFDRKAEYNNYVEASGTWYLSDGKCASIVVAVRPERRNKDGYVEAVVSAFTDLK